MFWDLLYALSAPVVMFGASAAELVPPIIPQTFDATQLVSESLLAQAPPAAGEPGAPAADIRAFLINHKPCAESGYHLTYRIIVRNYGTVPVFDLVVQNQYPGTWSAAEFPTAERPPDIHDPLAHLLIWNEGFLAPGSFVNYTFTVRVGGGGGVLTDNLTVTYLPAAGPATPVFTNLVIPGTCPIDPLVVERPRGEKAPAIICDPAEAGCRQILPGLGVNFQRAQQPENQVRICAPNDPRGCGPNRPALGIRFAEAIADIIPGDCRVVGDDVIVTPEFQDGLTRRSQPSAFYLIPLYEAGQNFRRIVLENAILGIGHTRRAQERLQNLRTQGEITNALADLKRQYEAAQTSRKAKFDPIARAAIEQAIQSIRRACGGDQGNNLAVIGLREALIRVKQEYDNNLDRRLAAYDIMQQAYLEEAKKFNQNDEEGEHRKKFDDIFARTFLAHRKEDEASDNRVRLEQWEVALDGPKAAATDCEKENVFAAEVETKATWCESNGYIPRPNVAVREPVGAKPGVAPPELNDLRNAGPGAVILPALVRGTVCGGAPGDPWWESECKCKCNDMVRCPTDGVMKLCQVCYKDTLTRHDIFVPTKEECVADGPGHQDPFL